MNGSIDSLVWGSVSTSFDDMDIGLTRPGFGVVVLLKNNYDLKEFRKNCDPFLLMRTRDSCLHMTVFQVFLSFRREYNPYSLPNNLLECLRNYISHAVENDIREINYSFETLSVRANTSISLFGKYYPSHLVLHVDCWAVSSVLQEFKEKVNRIGYEWMTQLVPELEKRHFQATVYRSEIGSKLSSDGWDLTIAYTANRDYQTHVTMGILPTSDTELDQKILEVCGDDVERKICGIFSPEKGKVEKEKRVKQLNFLMEFYRIRELKYLKEEDIIDYPTLKAQVHNAKTGNKIEWSKTLIDEWGKVKVKAIDEKLEKNIFLIEVSKIHMSFLNMERMQNFEKVA